MKKIALLGGSLNPPGLHHRKMAERLAALPFIDEVVIVPCGPRPDKGSVNDVDSIHRAVMADITFKGIPKVTVDLFDLENGTFTRTCKLDDIYREKGEIWHVVGTDLVRGGNTGGSKIQRKWVKGTEIWNRIRFIVFNRPNFACGTTDYPPNNTIIDGFDGSSSLIRENIFRHESFEHLVAPEVANYIKRFGLYRGVIPPKSARFELDKPRVLIVADEYNPQALEIAGQYKPLADDNNPNCVLVIGGDGTMLRAIRGNWRKRLPFVGINTGHRGFLMNSIADVPRNLILKDWTIEQSPLLFTEFLNCDGEWRNTLAFNDVWVERDGGMSVSLEVKINGITRISKLEGDGILLATSAGSTAYANKMGAIPFRNSTNLVLVGSHANWDSAYLSISDEVELKNLEPEKRPIRAFADSVPLGNVLVARMRVSRIAAAELVFSPQNNIAEKLLQIQFPQRP